MEKFQAGLIFDSLSSKFMIDIFKVEHFLLLDEKELLGNNFQAGPLIEKVNIMFADRLKHFYNSGQGSVIAVFETFILAVVVV